MKKESFLKKFADIKFVSKKHWINHLIPMLLALFIICLSIAMVSFSVAVITFSSVLVLIVVLFLLAATYIKVLPDEELIAVSDGEIIILPAGKYFLFPNRVFLKQIISLKEQHLNIMPKKDIEFAHGARFKINLVVNYKITDAKNYYLSNADFVISEIIKPLMINFFIKRSWKTFLPGNRYYVIEDFSLIINNPSSIINFLENICGIRIYSLAFSLLEKIRDEEIDDKKKKIVSGQMIGYGDGC